MATKVPKAKGKIKAKKRRQEAQNALESDAGTVRVVKRERGAAVSAIGIAELRNVIADTLLRVLDEEFRYDLDDLNAREYFGHEIARSMKYGMVLNDAGRVVDGSHLQMREHEYKHVPYCREHKV